MNPEILAFYREQSLKYLEAQLLSSNDPSDWDKLLDKVIRQSKGMEDGRLYGFLAPPVGISDLPPGTIRAKRDTKMKMRPIAHNYLKDEEWWQVPVGTKIACTVIMHDQHQHLFIEIEGGKRGYIYAPHWELPESEKKKEVKLAVDYAWQRDNWEKYHGPGGRQCCLTVHSMCANYLLDGDLHKQAIAKGYVEAEDLYGEVLYQYGDTTNPQAHTPAMKDFGLDSYFTYTGSIKDLLLCLDKDVPVPMGVAYKASGHYILGVGYNEKGVYIHDPFGIRIGTTDNYDPSPGDYDFVTWDWLQAKFVDVGNEAGWMRVVTAVKGKPTGLPIGM